MMSNLRVDVSEYKRAFERARADLEALVEQREEIDKRIAQLKQAIIALAPMAKENPPILATWSRLFAAFGVTDAIREVLRTADVPLTPLEVRDRLIQMKPDVQTQSNLMASIHTVLKRLVPHEAISSTNEDGDVVYRWKPDTASKAAALNSIIRDSRSTHVLSGRQRQLIKLVANGLTNKEIAANLNLSEFTVRNHIHRIMKSVDADSRLDPSRSEVAATVDTEEPNGPKN